MIWSVKRSMSLFERDVVYLQAMLLTRRCAKGLALLLDQVVSGRQTFKVNAANFYCLDFTSSVLINTLSLLDFHLDPFTCMYRALSAPQYTILELSATRHHSLATHPVVES